MADDEKETAAQAKARMAAEDEAAELALDRAGLDGPKADDPPWKSDKNAPKAEYLVKCNIKGRTQGKRLKIGDVVTLEVTDDIAHMVRPGVLEFIQDK